MPGEDEHEHTPPRIDIFWANTQDAIINPLMHMVMIESKSGYFEGVRHTLRGLQLQWDTKYVIIRFFGNYSGRGHELIEKELDSTSTL